MAGRSVWSPRYLVERQWREWREWRESYRAGPSAEPLRRVVVWLDDRQQVAYQFVGDVTHLLVFGIVGY